MFPPMRRAHQQLSDEDTKAILERGTSGVLALVSEDGYPYAVPMSYAYHKKSLIFHSAVAGHKIDAMKNSPKASFCVIDKDEVVADEYTTWYRSVIVFGTIRVLDRAEAREGALVLGQKYRPGFSEEAKAVVERNLDKMVVFSLDIEHMTGKQAKELVSGEKDRE